MELHKAAYSVICKGWNYTRLLTQLYVRGGITKGCSLSYMQGVELQKAAHSVICKGWNYTRLLTRLYVRGGMQECILSLSREVGTNNIS